MRDALIVNACVGVQDGCEITCNTEGRDGAYFTVRSADSPPFEFSFTAGALRQFIAVGNKALADLDELNAVLRSRDRRSEQPRSCSCQTAERPA